MDFMLPGISNEAAERQMPVRANPYSRKTPRVTPAAIDILAIYLSKNPHAPH